MMPDDGEARNSPTPSVWERLDSDTKEIRASDARAEQKASILLGISIGSLALATKSASSVHDNVAALVPGYAGVALLFFAICCLLLAVRPSISVRSDLRDVSWTRLRLTADSRSAFELTALEPDHQRQLRIATLNRGLAARAWRKNRLILFAVMAMLASLSMIAASVVFWIVGGR